ncbi:carboxypeptidase regulatory-like domain-containing protein [bacterium]|nr:carboxypeptidase regulatory-like domain-containing protein [bacterium]
MSNRLCMLILVLLIGLVAASCGGGTTDPPVNFTRLTAQVLDSQGAPMAGLAVRVEGSATGVTSDANGTFSLTANAFPNGVTATNEISVGRDGLVLGNLDVVPAEDTDLVLKFGDNFGLTVPGGTEPGTNPNPGATPGTLSGHVYDDVNADPLGDVELTLYSSWGELLFTSSNISGEYNFGTVPAGDWQLLASKSGYYPEAASISIPEGIDVVQHLSLVPKNVIKPGDGVIVRGVILDSETSAPVAGATVSLFADTGWCGMPEPAVYDDIAYADVEVLVDSAESNSQGPTANPVWYEEDPDDWEGDDDKDASVAAYMYEPQYLETTTAADGSFEFEDEIVAYSVWLDFYADGYLNGNHYEYIEGRQGTLVLNLTMDAYVETSISGTVVDENSAPVAGAYVEFIYAGSYDVIPFDMAVPGGMGMDDVAEESRASWETFDSPPPPSTNDAGGSGGWDDWAEEAADTLNGATGTPQAGTTDSGSGVDNALMQRFRWENQQANRGTSQADYFTGYYSTVTDETGAFNFEDVPAGYYYVFASAYRHLPYSADLEIVENPTDNVFPIVVANVPVGAVQGTVVDENGNPVPDCLVNATQPNVDPFTYSDETGHYLIENVPTGTWTISAYKSGYLTRSEDTEITDGGTATINLVIDHYTPAEPTTINYGGHVINGSTNGGVVNADLVFTPVNNEYGGWFQHVLSEDNGAYAAVLIPTEYNVLIQKDGYEDLYIRIWVDSLYPSMDFWLYEIGTSGGPWGGGGIAPMVDTAVGMPERGEDDE